MKKILFFLLLFVHLSTTAQTVKFEVKFSKPFAVLEFIQSLSSQSGPNPFRKIFNISEFNTGKYNGLIAAFDAIPIDYEYAFRDYPPFTKRGGSAEYLLKQTLLNTATLQDFKMRSLGLIPISDLNELVLVITEFTPIYEKLIYEPNKTTFEKQVKDIETLLTEKNIAFYFDQAKEFYKASWDNSIPFLFTFYPLPESKGFTATTYSNIAVSAIPTSLTDYNAMLSVLLHELSHVLYDAESLSFKKGMDGWFSSSPSLYSRYAYNLLNESWATAVGNGYFAEKLSGKLNPGSWYNRKYISLMGKLMYPAIKEYIDNRKPIDKSLVDRYIKIYEDSISHSVNELDYLLNGRYGISDNPADFDTLNRLFPRSFANEYYHDFSKESFEKLKQSVLTKFIIVSGNNKKKLILIKDRFPELKSWQPDVKKDFTNLLFLADKTQLIVINLVKNSLAKQLSIPLK
ncbi:MAG TPA: hypothetical protein VLJ68_08970 [Chitinophagaceae bacterium]|nr:hypothetical protein [Chitinophagaceae bacterium]